MNGYQIKVLNCVVHIIYVLSNFYLIYQYCVISPMARLVGSETARERQRQGDRERKKDCSIWYFTSIMIIVNYCVVINIFYYYVVVLSQMLLFFFLNLSCLIFFQLFVVRIYLMYSFHYLFSIFMALFTLLVYLLYLVNILLEYLKKSNLTIFIILLINLFNLHLSFY